MGRPLKLSPRAPNRVPIWQNFVKQMQKASKCYLQQLGPPKWSKLYHYPGCMGAPSLTVLGGQSLYWFPIATIEKYNSVASNNMNLLSYSSGGQKPQSSITELKPRGWQGSIPSGSLREESTSSPFAASGGRLHSLALSSWPAVKHLHRLWL